MNFEELRDSLSVMTSGVEDEISVTIETGPDEAFMVGTERAFLRLAESLVAAVLAHRAGVVPESNLDGMRIHQQLIDGMFDPLADVVPDCMFLVATDADREWVTAYFRWAGGEGPRPPAPPPSSEHA